MEEDIKLTYDQYLNLVKLSGIEISPEIDSSENVSRSLIALERKLNFFNYPLSFFTAESINVLIVDDMELSIYQLTSMLKKIGVNVYVARNKEEALTELKKKKIDYLIIDLFLPDAQDGFDLIKEANRIKSEDEKDFKLIVISGTDDTKMVQECYKYGVDEFIPKQPLWHEGILKFISNSTNKSVNEEFAKYYINDSICVLTIYKINNEKYLDKILKEANTNILTGKPNIILNLEHIKIFSDSYASIFADVYKATYQKDGLLILVKPCEDIKKALNYVFLNNVIHVFDTVEEAVEFVDLNEFMK